MGDIYQGDAKEITGTIELVSTDLSNPSYFTPEFANNFLKRIANAETAIMNSAQSSTLDSMRSQIMFMAIKLAVLDTTVSFEVNGPYFVDDLSDMSGAPPEWGVPDTVNHRFIMP